MIDRTMMTEMLRRMYRIRFFEERIKQFYDYRGYFAVEAPDKEAQTADELLTCVSYEFASEGMIGGAVHLSIGQEAVPVGVCANLNADDAVLSTHRSHGHFIAKGGSVREALAELMGRATGCSRGCGGSMHLFDPGITFLGGNGIVGGGIPIALGPAFAAKYRGTDRVSVGFFSDGAANQGTFHEALNLAAIWKLPVIFVCENNLYANVTPYGLAFATPDIASRAAGYGIPGVTVDGQDALAMYEAASEAVGRARAGDGPTLIEAKTYRYEGHCGVSSSHQNPEECAEWRQRDPIVLHQQKLVAEGTMTEAEVQAMRDEITAEIDEAEEFAKSSPLADPAALELPCIPGRPAGPAT
jgi:TPP-dependent pyruvate/acetoin dehydrogenase alpha subunit